MNPQLQTRLSACAERVDQALRQALSNRPSQSSVLQAAMDYSLFNGGKRLRPLLVYSVCEALGADLVVADPAAMAVELIHTYSLVHDDLPAMDDDDLRRGRPTCHKAYDEATAILVGDALQSLAFEVLTEAAPETVGPLVQTLAQAGGHRGMVAGQMLDLQAEGQSITLTDLQALHELKTGALIRAAVRMGGLVAQANASTLACLDEYATCVGLAFQVQDDLLDVTGDAQVLGKKTGADAALHKATYPALLGLSGAQQKAQALVHQAQQSLQSLPGDWQLLALLADWCVSRDH